jgi:RNA polymerase sigma-70 factor (ECF subfamily)
VTEVDLAELVKRANAGDRAARHELLAELYSTVRKHVYFLVGGPLADDVVQDTMIAVYRGLPRFRGDAHPRTWALTIAHRTAARSRRKERRHAGVDEAADTGGLDVAPAAAAELVLLRRALDTLAPKKRDAFVMMAIFEMSAQEAGKALGTFANTAASRYRHARAELEAYLSRTKIDEVTQVAATKDVGHV